VDFAAGYYISVAGTVKHAVNEKLNLNTGTSSAIVFQAGTAAGDQPMESIMTAQQNQNEQNQNNQNH